VPPLLESQKNLAQRNKKETINPIQKNAIPIVIKKSSFQSGIFIFYDCVGILRRSQFTPCHAKIPISKTIKNATHAKNTVKGIKFPNGET
jgi:hypothetical protein